MQQILANSQNPLIAKRLSGRTMIIYVDCCPTTKTWLPFAVNGRLKFRAVCNEFEALFKQYNGMP